MKKSLFHDDVPLGKARATSSKGELDGDIGSTPIGETSGTNPIHTLPVAPLRESVAGMPVVQDAGQTPGTVSIRPAPDAPLWKVCPVCDGEGQRGYADTTMGRGGCGGQMITVGSCNRCMGLGRITDPHAPGGYALLEKYIAYVGDCEGVDYITGRDRPPQFTDTEWAVLRWLAHTPPEPVWVPCPGCGIVSVPEGEYHCTGHTTPKETKRG